MEALAHVLHVLQEGLAAAGAAGGDAARDHLLKEVGQLAGELARVLEEHSSQHDEKWTEREDGGHTSPLGSLLDVRRDSSPVMEMGMEVEEAIAAMERDAVREQLYTRFSFAVETVDKNSPSWALLSRATVSVQCPSGGWARLLLPLERTRFLCELLLLQTAHLAVVPCIYDTEGRQSVAQTAAEALGEEAKDSLMTLCERCARGDESFKTTSVAVLKLLLRCQSAGCAAFTTDLVHSLAGPTHLPSLTL